MMKTNDRFANVEEHDHILKMREASVPEQEDSREDQTLDADLNPQMLHLFFYGKVE